MAKKMSSGSAIFSKAAGVKKKPIEIANRILHRQDHTEILDQDLRKIGSKT